MGPEAEGPEGGAAPPEGTAASRSVGGEIIAMGRYPWTGPLSGGDREERERVRAAAAQFEVDHLLDRDCAQLSEGQRQLVQLARLAAQDAPILLLDEPNTALDFDNTALLFDRITSDGGGGKVRPDGPP